MNPPTGAATFDHHEAPTLTGADGRSGSGPLVLVVDDDPDARAIYSATLIHLGYRTAQECSGEQAVAATVRLRPHALLMDLAMPGMGGVEATRRIKSDERTRATLVVAVTAHGPSLFDEARGAGCDAYFCKPFNAFALHTVLTVLGSTSPEGSATARPIVKTCSCGRTFGMKSWRRLPFCGRMHAPRTGQTVELRNCTCGSSIVLPEGGDEDEEDSQD